MRCEVNASCKSAPSVAVLYEESPGGDALLMIGCRGHVEQTIWHYGTPAVLLWIGARP